MRKRLYILPLVVFASLITMPALYLTVKPELGGLNLPTANASREGLVTSKEKILTDMYTNTLIRSYSFDKNFEFKPGVAGFGLDSVPSLNSRNAISVNLTSGEIVYEKNARQRVPIASLTKIMTAVIALEHKDMKDKITISEKAATVGENSMGITEGEVYTLEELLYGLILNSGNDAAFAIAEGVSENADNFVYWMNLKAKELGLTDTQFSDPSGLNDSTYSTAYDLAKLTKYAMNDPDFRRIVSTVEYTIPYSADHKFIPLSNQTNLLTTYPGVLGVKTGYTGAAKLCLVSYAKNSGQEIVGVVLQSDARKTDMIKLLDYSFSKAGITIHHPLLDF